MSKIEKRDKKIRKKSSCWLFYTKNERGGICKLCQKRIISSGNTTNLLNHLKRKHKIQWETAIEDDDDFSDSHMEFEVVEETEEESSELRRSTKEAHEQGLAYQSLDGRTVIWLHPDVQLDQLSSALQPQITLVEHAPSSDNDVKATVEVSGDTERAGILSMGQLVQKEEDTMGSDDVMQKADTTDSLVRNKGEVIPQEGDINSSNIAQIVTVSSSEDPSPEDNSVSSSPSKIVLANLVTSDTSKIMLDNIKTTTSNMILGDLTKTTSLPKRTVVVTCTPSFKARPIQPKPEWVPIQIVGQTLMNGVQNKSSVQRNVSILKNRVGVGYGRQNSTGNCGEQNSVGNCGRQNSADNCDGQNSADNCDGQNSAGNFSGQKSADDYGSYEKQNDTRRMRRRQKKNGVQREDSFDHFGKYIAALLRNLPSKKSASRLQKEMINWVLKEQILYED